MGTQRAGGTQCPFQGPVCAVLGLLWIPRISFPRPSHLPSHLPPTPTTCGGEAKSLPACGTHSPSSLASPRLCSSGSLRAAPAPCLAFSPHHRTCQHRRQVRLLFPTLMPEYPGTCHRNNHRSVQGSKAQVSKAWHALPICKRYQSVVSPAFLCTVRVQALTTSCFED